MRHFTVISLALYNMGIMLFAYLPPETLNVAEAGYAVVSGLALIGLLLHTKGVAWARWSYLLTAWIGLTMFLVYETFDVTSPLFVKVGIGLFLLSGVVNAWNAHLMYGGPNGVA